MKLKYKKIFITALSFMMMFSTLVTKINAQVGDNHNVQERFVSGWYYSGGAAYGTGTVLSIDGEVAFCLQSNKSAQVGNNQEILLSDLGINPQLSRRLGLIAYYGYREVGKSNDTNYFLTNNLIWTVLKNAGISTDAGLVYSAAYPNLNSMQTFFDDVMSKVNSFEIVPSFDGSSYTVNANNSIVINDNNNVLSTMSIKSIAPGLSASINNNSLTITASANAPINSYISLTKNIPVEETQKPFAVRNGNSQAISVCRTGDPVFSDINITVNKFGSLLLTKTNEIGNLIDGAIFNLKSVTPGINYNQNITVTGGRIKVDELIIGDYILTEIQAPDGHVATQTAYQITINVDQTTEKIVVNKLNPKGKIIINKTDEKDSNALKDVEFEVLAVEDIYSVITLEKLFSKGDSLGKYITDVNGQIVIDDLPMGKLKVVETKTLDGYVLDEFEHNIEFRQEDFVTKLYTKTLDLTNKKTEIEVSKIDSTGKELTGASMSILDENKEVITTWISEEQPFVFEGLTEGKTYYVHEDEAPTGYKLAQDISFVAGDNIKVKMEDELILTDIKVNKIDEQTKEAIISKDFEFTLYVDEECTEVLSTVKANTIDGTATFKDIQFGTYYIKETKAPEGYLLSTEVKKVVVDENLLGVGDVYSFEYQNSLMPLIATNDSNNIDLMFGLFLIGLTGIVIFGARKHYIKRKNEV